MERVRVRLVQLRTIRTLLYSLAVGVSTMFVLRLVARILGNRDADELASSTTVDMLLQGPLAFTPAVVAAGLVWWWSVSQWDQITPVRAALWYE